MTDKQIIVDDIDVSKCEFLIISNDKQLCRCVKSDLFGGIEFVENAKKGNCKDNPNCYYKQLKCKEQELKNICKAFDIEYAIDEETGNLIGRCNKLSKKEQECEELKKANDGILTTIRILAKNNLKLREILTEIKEIANYSFNRATSEYMAKLELILEKISEI